MRNFYIHIFLGFITSLLGAKSFAHSVQVGYCVNCNGDLRVYVEHWHAIPDYTTTMNIQLNVNGVLTTINGSPTTFITGKKKNELPECITPIISFGACPAGTTGFNCGADVCGYWAAYDFINVQRGVPISITIIDGGTNPNTEDGCGMFPISTPTFVIPLNANPTAGPNQTICTGSSASVSLANYTGTLQWQESSSSTGPWTNIAGATTVPLNTGALTATKYYQAIVTGDCGSLTSNVATVAVGSNPVANAGSNISTCASSTPANVGTTPITGYTYNWLPTSGLSNPNASNPTVDVSTIGSTTYTLTVSAPGCPDSKDEVLVNVTDLPTATISGTATVCQGTTGNSITFSGSGGTPPYTFTYKLNNGSSLTATSTGNVASVNPPTNALGTFTYDLVSVTDKGGAGCSKTQSGTATITVGPAATATITGTTAVCVNDPAPKIAFTGLTGTPPFTFLYTINNGTPMQVSTDASTTTLSATTTTAGAFTYSLTGVMDANMLACASTGGSAVVTVNNLPVASISGSTAVCLNAPQPDITFTGLVGAPPFTFNYSVNNGTVQSVSSGSGSTATIKVPTNAIGTFIYSNSSPSSVNCRGSASDTAIVTVSPLPTATISGSATVCQNDFTDIVFTGSNGTPPYTFTYKINNGVNQTISTTSGSSSVTLSAQANSTSSITYSLVSVKDSSTALCSNAASGTAVITIKPSVIASVSGTTSICQTLPPPDITFTGTNGTPPYTFTYAINNGTPQTISTSSGNSVKIKAPTTVAGTFVYKLSGIQDNGNSICYIANDSAVVTVNALPTANMVGTTEICQNATPAHVTFAGSNGIPPYTFVYTINNGVQLNIKSIGDTAVLDVPTNNAGVFTYKLISVGDSSAAGCSQSQNGSAVITVNPTPIGNITGVGNICQNAPATDIVFTGSNGTPPYTFTYTLNNGTPQTISTTAGNSANITVSTSATGAQNYTLIRVTESSSTGCVDSTQRNASVNVLPLPRAIINGPAAVCQNSAANILFTGSGGQAPYTFAYKLNNDPSQTITATGNIATLTANTTVSGPHTYVLESVQDGSPAACSSIVTGNSTVTVMVNPLPIGTAGSDVSVCLNDPSPEITFTGNNGTPPYNFIYNINGGASQSISTVNGSSVAVNVPTNKIGNFNYALLSVNDAAASACVNTMADTALASVHAIPSAAFSVENEVVNTSDPRIFVTDESKEVNAWIWDFGDGDSALVQDPVSHTYERVGEYVITLTVESEYGCVDDVAHIVTVETPYLIFIPNAFSPNGDGKNEVFNIKGEGITEFEMLIFDRWGNFIFYSDDMDEGWNGTANQGAETAQADVYVYSVKLVDLKGKPHSYKGLVSLIK